MPDPDPPIRYVALALGEDRASDAFVRFLGTAAAEAILCRNGFLLTGGHSC